MWSIATELVCVQCTAVLSMQLSCCSNLTAAISWTFCHTVLSVAVLIQLLFAHQSCSNDISVMQILGFDSSQHPRYITARKVVSSVCHSQAPSGLQHQHERTGSTCHAGKIRVSRIPVQSHMRQFLSMLLTCCQHIPLLIMRCKCTWLIY